jgi:glycosyltransferase involved in cell wall biosynthesis
MRITFVAPRYPPMLGGVELHVQRLAESAARSGHDVTVLCHRNDRHTLPRTELINGVRLVRFQALITNQNFTYAPGLWAHLARYGAELGVVHAHAYHALPALGAALFKQYPLVFTPHYHGTGHSPLRKALHPPYRKAGRLIFERADRVICVSGAERTLVQRDFPQVMGWTTVIHNGVDIDQIRSAVPFDAPGTLILSAGRMERYKHVDMTIGALAHLPAPYSLVITGDGPERGELEALAGRLGLGDRVRFLGRVSDEDLHRWFRTAAAFVSLSTNEAYPITLLEVLEGGARVLASDIPAHRELAAATGGTMSLIAPDSTPEAVARALQTLVAEPVATPAVDSWDEITAQTIEVYREAAEAAS